ncbi:MAG: 7-cyano-7-deazaguanine synthase [Acidimicrobiia bacterium]|nr:7-cyano-7-deazaguanine synthase [Acidimicrobiia bacterium]
MEKELQTLEVLRTLLIERYGVDESRLAPLRALAIQTIDVSPEDERCYQVIRDRAFLGDQWRWLPAVARAVGPDAIEVSVHQDDNATRIVKDLVVASGGTGADKYYELASFAGAEERHLFGSFTFPLFEFTKLDMERSAKEAGFIGLMEATWFCHSPTARGRPCGICNPCEYTKQEGLGRRVPSSRSAGVVVRRLRGKASWRYRQVRQLWRRI